MNLIFICSYLNVTCVIDTIEHENGDFRILTADTGLVKLFSELYGNTHVIELPKLFHSFGNVKLFSNDLYHLQQYKKEFLKLFAEINPSKVIFYYLGWNGFESWLIKQVSSDAEVYYRPKVDVNCIEKNYSLKLIIKTFIASFIYGIKFNSSKWYGYSMITIGDSFLKRVRAQKYEHDFDLNNVRNFVNTRFDKYKNIKVLLLVGGEYNLDRCLYDKKLHELYDILIKYYNPEQIGIKNHPNFPIISFDWATDSVDLPADIPSSLLCFISDVVIAYGSATLYEAADMGLTAISFAHIVPSTSHGQAQRTEKYLLDNLASENIDFPKDINAFDHLFMMVNEE